MKQYKDYLKKECHKDVGWQFVCKPLLTEVHIHKRYQNAIIFILYMNFFDEFVYLGLSLLFQEQNLLNFL
jgi:hypothetical protein